MTRGVNLVIHFCPLLHVRVVYFLTLFLPIYISSTYLDYVCFFFQHVPGFHLAVQQHYFWLSHVSLPFTNILHLIFHHLLLFAFLPPCAHFMYIFSTSLSAYYIFHRPFLTILFRCGYLATIAAFLDFHVF